MGFKISTLYFLPASPFFSHFLCPSVAPLYSAVPPEIPNCSLGTSLPWVAVWRSSPAWCSSPSCYDFDIPSRLSHSFFSFLYLAVFSLFAHIFERASPVIDGLSCVLGGLLEPAGTSCGLNETDHEVFPQRPPCSPHSDNILHVLPKKRKITLSSREKNYCKAVSFS